MDTGVFADDRYADVTVEYAKAGPDDILIRISATNHGPDSAELHLLPTLWFRNTWAWDGRRDPTVRPSLRRVTHPDGQVALLAEHFELGHTVLTCEGTPGLLFTENETNVERLFNAPSATPFVKDGIHEAVVHGQMDAVNPAEVGTKAAAHYRLVVAPGATATVRLRLTLTDLPIRSRPAGTTPDVAADRLSGPEGLSGVVLDGAMPATVAGQPASDGVAARDDVAHSPPSEPFADFDAVFGQRIAEADAFYTQVHPAALSPDERLVQRQSLAGLVWSKQWYYFDVDTWLTSRSRPSSRARSRASATASGRRRSRCRSRSPPT